MYLIVCAHGFLSGPYSLKKITEKLQTLPDVTLLISKVNSGEVGTSDGIINAGLRLSYEIIEFVKDKNLKYISFIGSSMGGLISRVAIGLLCNVGKGTIADLIPLIYVSLGTPHLGILETTIFNKNMGYLLTHSNESMEDFNLTSDTLLIISDPKTVYLIGLSYFKGRWVFTNVDNDGLVNYSSAGITKVYWELQSNTTDILGIFRDYKDHDYIELKDSKENKILENLQLLEWNRVISSAGSSGLISHAIVSTGFSPFYKSEIIPVLVDILTLKI
jgi:triacylglycerol esterase/lipase EstA (alpha/beta hydrolase family)